MSYFEPGKDEVQQAMLGVAQTMAAKAQALKEFAESISEASEEEMLEQFGGEYASPAIYRQWMEEITKATTARPSETREFERVFTEFFARAQREGATKAAEAKAQSTAFADSQSQDR